MDGPVDNVRPAPPVLRQFRKERQRRIDFPLLAKPEPNETELLPQRKCAQRHHLRDPASAANSRDMPARSRTVKGKPVERAHQRVVPYCAGTQRGAKMWRAIILGMRHALAIAPEDDALPKRSTPRGSRRSSGLERTTYHWFSGTCIDIRQTDPAACRRSVFNGIGRGNPGAMRFPFFYRPAGCPV